MVGESSEENWESHISEAWCNPVAFGYQEPRTIYENEDKLNLVR